jgi:hypothetical protein
MSQLPFSLFQPNQTREPITSEQLKSGMLLIQHLSQLPVYTIQYSVKEKAMLSLQIEATLLSESGIRVNLSRELAPFIQNAMAVDSEPLPNTILDSLEAIEISIRKLYIRS